MQLSEGNINAEAKRRNKKNLVIFFAKYCTVASLLTDNEEVFFEMVINQISR